MPVSWFHRPLDYLAQGPDVDLVQRKLNCRLSGVYTQETMARVRAVQIRNGLEPTGVVDAETAEFIGEDVRYGLVPDWWHRDLLFGDGGPDVAALRLQLGLSEGDRFDRETDAAVRRFQSSRLMIPSGVVDQDVAIALGDVVPLIQT